MATKKTTLSKEEQEELKEDFYELPKDQWKSLRYGTLLRYEHKTTGFKSKCYFISYIVTKDQEMISFSIDLRNSEYTWTTKIDSIKKLYVSRFHMDNPKTEKIEKKVLELLDEVKKNKICIVELTKEIKEMKKETNEQSKLISKLFKQIEKMKTAKQQHAYYDY